MTTVSMPHESGPVIVGVDTHADVHVAAAVDHLGRMLGRLEVATTPSGYKRLLRWSQSLGSTPAVFGVEGTGSYGAGLARYLAESGCTVVEINRPDRRARRAHGKSDPIDAEAAGRAVLAGSARCVPKSGQDRVGMIRNLRMARRSAVKMRTITLNQIDALVLTAPDALRSRLRELSGAERVQICASFRPGAVTSVTAAAKASLRCLAIRYSCLGDELEVLEPELARLTAEAAPALVALRGVGPDVAGALLVAAGDNPQSHRSPRPRGRPIATGSTAAAIGAPTTRSGAS
jgi:transposase